jgi:hypothetical protein
MYLTFYILTEVNAYFKCVKAENGSSGSQNIGTVNPPPPPPRSPVQLSDTLPSHLSPLQTSSCLHSRIKIIMLNIFSNCLQNNVSL